MPPRPTASVLCVALLAACATTPPGPRPTPPMFMSLDKNITFQAPPGSTYCPLPRGWVGSDHGTVIFLAPPQSCVGAGYASIARTWTGSEVPAISVYYGYDVVDPDDRESPEPCHEIGRAPLLGAERPLCRSQNIDGISVRAEVAYPATGAEEDIPADVAFMLQTTPERLDQDLAAFVALLASVATCEAQPPGYATARPPCPPKAKFF